MQFVDDIYDAAKGLFADVLNVFENRAEEFAEKYDIDTRDFVNEDPSQDRLEVDYNSFVHAHASFELTFNFGNRVAEFFGWAKELTSEDFEMTDSLRDEYNNAVGNVVGDYARSVGLSYEDAGELLAEAINGGCLASYDLDPRTMGDDAVDLAGQCVMEMLNSLGDLSGSLSDTEPSDSDSGLEGISEPSTDAESSPSSSHSGGSFFDDDAEDHRHGDHDDDDHHTM
ncbi:hypothetical protein [Halovulum sp. GXIMD14793]